MSASIRVMDYIKCIIDVNGNTRYYIRLDRNWLKKGDRSYDKRFTILSNYPKKISENCYEYEIDVEKYNGVSPEIGDFFTKDEQSNLSITPGWRELSKDINQSLTEKQLKKFLHDVFYGRIKEREKKRKEEKKRKQEIEKFLKEKKVNFNDIPVDVQAYYIHYIINPYYAIGINYYNELKQKYPDYI